LSGLDVSFDPSDDNEMSPSTYLTDDSADPLLKLEYETDSNTDSRKLEIAMSKLDSRSKDVIKQRYLNEDKSTLEELSKKYNVSIERIRQIENKSLGLLKDSMLLA